MADKTFLFWYRWLLVISIVSVLSGLLIAFFGNTFLFEFHNAKISETFFHGSIPDNAQQFKQFIYGPLGGTISGYFILQFFIVKFAFQNKQSWSWYAIGLGLIVWFFIDSIVSVISGAYFNVYTINMGTLLLHAPPLIMTFKYFHHNNEE